MYAMYATLGTALIRLIFTKQRISKTCATCNQKTEDGTASCLAITSQFAILLASF